MSIKQKIKLKSYRGRGTRDATGAPLDLSDNAKASDESSALDGENIRRDVPADDNVFNDKTVSNDYKSGGAYKAMLQLFNQNLEDERYAEHCKKFFKGEDENNT
jgi:hypothetical protein